MTRTQWIALVGGMATCTGCSDAGSPSNTPETGSAVLADGALVLDDVGLAALASVDQQGNLVFSSTSPVLDRLEKGNVLIIGAGQRTPRGALVEVESVAPQGPGWILGTRQASLSEAFQELHVSVKTTVSAETAPTLALMAGDQKNGIAFPFSLSASDNAGSIRLDGSLSLAPQVDLEVDIDVLEFKLKTLALTFGASETFTATFTAQGQASIDESVTLGAFDFTPIILTIPTPAGAVPVVLTPRVEALAGLTGKTQGSVEAGVTQDAGYTAGLGYHDGAFGGFSDSHSSFDFDQPSYEAGVNLKATAGPRLEVLVYGAVGPYAEVQGYVALGANAGGPPPCATGVIDAGLTAKVGVDFLADYETTLFDKNFPLASFDSCSQDPNAPRPAVTWARSFGREGSPGERAKAVTQLSDGTYAVVGDSDVFSGVEGYAASIWAMRLDPLGNVLWQRAFQRLGLIGVPHGLQEVPGGILVATTSGLMKLDTGGNLLWARTYDNGQYLEMGSLAASANGSIVVAGIYGNQASAWAMGVDSVGDVIWSRRFAGADFARVRATSDGGVILVGARHANNGDLYLVKLDAAGGVQWQVSVDDLYDSTDGKENAPLLSGIDRGNDVVEKPGGGYIAVGESYGSYPVPEPGQGGFFVPWLIDVDAAGNLLSSTVYRAPSDALYGSAYAVAVRPNGSTLVVGRRADAVSDLLSSEDILLIQGGTFSALGGSGNDAVYPALSGARNMPLQLTHDGGAIVAATSTSFAGQEQFWLVKLNRTGNIRFPYEEGLSGTAYSTDKAVSVAITPATTDVPIGSTDVTASVPSEITGELHDVQAP